MLFKIHKYGFYFFNHVNHGARRAKKERIKSGFAYEKVSPLQNVKRRRTKPTIILPYFISRFLFETVRSEARKMCCTIDARGRREKTLCRDVEAKLIILFY
jgi:hypothetical protein